MRIGRFVLKAGEKIPLHIHAGQFGLAYLLSGKCNISTYLVAETGHEFHLTLDKKQILTAHTYSILTPKVNAHQIEVIEECVFLDIFAPGKAEGKLSDFLEIIQEKKNGAQLVARKIPLEKVVLPQSLLNNIDNYLAVV